MLAENIRTSDMAGRYGGEEFCIVLPETTEAQATLWAERVRRTIAALRITCGETTINMTCSFGVAQRMADTTSSDQLVDQADQALIVAKRSGRDRVVPYRSLTQASLLQSDANDPAELLRGVPVHNVMSSIVAPLNENDTVASGLELFPSPADPRRPRRE